MSTRVRQLVSTYSLFDGNETSTWVASSGPQRFLDDLASGQRKDWIVSGSFAASSLVSVTAAETAVIYNADPERIARLNRLHPTKIGANVVLAHPYDVIVFERTRDEDGRRSVSVAQTAADLLTGSARMPEQGERLSGWTTSAPGRLRRRAPSPPRCSDGHPGAPRCHHADRRPSHLPPDNRPAPDLPAVHDRRRLGRRPFIARRRASSGRRDAWGRLRPHGRTGHLGGAVERDGRDDEVTIPVDLIVPESIAPAAGWRSARLGGNHGKNTARKSSGVEGALVDRAPLEIAALDLDDQRSMIVNVAGDFVFTHPGDGRAGPP